MDLADFYSLTSITCFTLVGLWWTVVERHPDWKAIPSRRRLAGGVYLSFLLPGLMAMFAQVDSDNPLVWRTSFSAAAIVGLLTTLRLLAVERSEHRGPFRRFRWFVAVVYGLILLLTIVPTVATTVGATPLQAASIALILLVVMAHGMTWEFMMEPDAADPGATPQRSAGLPGEADRGSRPSGSGTGPLGAKPEES